MTEQIKKIPIGGLWEEPEWEIHYDEQVAVFGNTKMCKHAKEPVTVQRVTALGHPYTQSYFTIPRAVVATNEGGCNTTGVCLDCILENA